MFDPEKICKRNDMLEGKNTNWRSYHETVASWCLPRKAWQTTTRTTGERLKLGSLFDSTAIRGLKIMSAGFHSNLTNPSSKWFNLQSRRLELMNNHDVRIWFKQVEDKIYSVLGASNFDTTMQEFYMDLGCFGTAIVLILDDPKDKVRFNIVPLYQVNFEEDAQGRVNRLYRNYTMTIQQAFDLWGNKAGKVVLDKIKDKPTDTVDILWYVGPRDTRDAAKEDNLNMPYASVWIEKSKKELIKEEGFFEFPGITVRFYKDGTETFGFSPAMDALAEIAGVNAGKKTMLRASMKAADPALILPSKGFVLPLNLNPAALNYRDAKNSTHDDLQAIPSSGNIPITLEVLQAEQEAIKEAFFVPLFQALSAITKQMTVPEVQRRIAENMVLLGPVVGRCAGEGLDPLLYRVFSILARNGELPMMPEVLMYEGNEEFDIIYIGPLAKAQRESEIYSIESFLADVNAIGAIKPDIYDKIDEDKTCDIIAKIKGIDPSILRSDKDVQTIREQRAIAQDQANKLAQLQQGMDLVNTASQAHKTLQDATAK